MAKLSANGAEVARLKKNMTPGEDEITRTELLSIRTTGAILRKLVVRMKATTHQPERSITAGWKIAVSRMDARQRGGLPAKEIVERLLARGYTTDTP